MKNTIENTMIDDHFTTLSNLDNFPPDHIAHLRTLKESGFEPKVIYDIGSCVLHWVREARKFWPNAHYVLFEAMEEVEPLYQKYMRNGGGDTIQYFVGKVLSSSSGNRVKFWTNFAAPGGNSYYREKYMNSKFFTSYIEKETVTLDEVVKYHNFPLPDLIKIDTQGSERDILLGGRTVVQAAKRLIVEMQHSDYNEGAPKVEETLPFIESLGFKCDFPRFAFTEFDADYDFVRNK